MTRLEHEPLVIRIRETIDRILALEKRRVFEVDGQRIHPSEAHLMLCQMPGRDREAELPQPALRDDLPQLQTSEAWRSAFHEALWVELGERCLGCRTCTFVCPTCRCFDVRDEIVSSRLDARRIQRLRAWDACTMANYRRIAGGHNPRPGQEMRLQNRFYCKFSYYPDDFGPLGCVGCGRCVDACPVGVDIREVMAAVDRAVSTGAP